MKMNEMNNIYVSLLKMNEMNNIYVSLFTGI